jgi:hypothetical protein
MKKVEDHKGAILSAGLLFFLVYLHYAVVNPLILRNGDDWQYFGIFTSQPLPRIGWWNVTRLLPEHLMPITGYLSAFVIYPLVGDYLVASSIALAIVMALFVTVLFLAYYRLFIALCDKRLGLIAAMIVMALCFAVFKDNPADNVHMFFTTQYNLYFYYILPNILNSIIILELMRQIALNDHLSLWPPTGGGGV